MLFSKPEYQTEDSELSACASELLHLITGKFTESPVITAEDRKHLTLEINKEIYVSLKNSLSQNINEKSKNIHLHYNPDLEPIETKQGDFHLFPDRLLRICNKYKSTNLIFREYIAYLKQAVTGLGSFAALPVNEWKNQKYAYQGFFSHLVKNNIIDISKGFYWCKPSVRENEDSAWWLFWQEIKGDELDKIGLSTEYVEKISLWIRNDTISISCFYKAPLTKAQNEITKKINMFLKDFRRFGEVPLLGKQIPYNTDDYTEKISWFESIINNLRKNNFREA